MKVPFLCLVLSVFLCLSLTSSAAPVQRDSFAVDFEHLLKYVRIYSSAPGFYIEQENIKQVVHQFLKRSVNEFPISLQNYFDSQEYRRFLRQLLEKNMINNGLDKQYQRFIMNGALKLNLFVMMKPPEVIYNAFNSMLRDALIHEDMVINALLQLD